MWPLHLVGPNTIHWWPSKNLLGPLIHERWSCCAFHRSNHATSTGVASLGNLGWVLTWVHMWLLPKNEVQMAHTELEMSKYHQGSCSVDEYINEFHKLVDCAKYIEGANTVLKFWHGLNPTIQNYIACLTNGQSSDDVPKDWYDAAIVMRIILPTLPSNWPCDLLELPS